MFSRSRKSQPRRDVRRLGHVTVPSGTLVIGDMGYLYMWSGDAEPVVADRGEDPKLLKAMADSMDLEIVGLDADSAARAANLQSLTYLYDIPSHGVEVIRSKFADLATAEALDVRVEATARVPHRERARRAADHGGSDFLIRGVWFAAVGDLPTDRALEVVGHVFDQEGPTGPRWASVELRVSDQAAAESRQIGLVGVDAARLIFADADALGSWRHDDSIDGLADVVFWGRDAAEAGQELGAPVLDEGYGWVNVDIPAAVGIVERVEAWRSVGQRRLAVDFRPHSHHFDVMSRVRSSKHQAGGIRVGGADMVALMTSWGDGIFPVEVDRAADGSLVAVRVNLGDDERAARIAGLQRR